MQQPSALELVLGWLDWRILATIGVLLLALFFPPVRVAIAALIRRMKSTPSHAPAHDARKRRRKAVRKATQPAPRRRRP